MKSHRHGFTLVELLIAISLLGVFSLLAFRLIGANFSVATATLLADGNAARFDHAIGMLRNDVSDAARIEMSVSGVLTITEADKSTIEWQTHDGSLSRKSASDKRSWDVGHPINLKMDGALVVVADQIAMAPGRNGAER